MMVPGCRLPRASRLLSCMVSNQTKSDSSWSRLRWALCGLAVLISVGCDAGDSRGVPREDAARVAVESALSAWRDGKPYDKLESTPPVRVVDSAWRNGEKIDSFEILDEEGRDDGTKAFSVRIGSSKAKGVKKAKFVVYGQDPLWVYREEDYKRMLQTERNIAAPRTIGKGARRGG